MNPGRRGVAFGFGAYFFWGIFPLYFRLMHRSGAFEILLNRVLWSLLLCVALLAATRSWADLRRVLGSRRQVLTLGAAAIAVAINWGVYIYAVNAGEVIEASLGYFINPLLTVALGVVLLGERLRSMQWVAVGIGVVAVAVLTVAYGHLPYIALMLAGSFGLYGLLKKQVGAGPDGVGAVAGLTTETLLLAPLAAIAVVVLTARGDSTFTVHAPWEGLLLASTGLVTVGPLLLFASAARRVPLTTIGLLQYLTPVLQLICGVLLLGEQMALSRWAGFALVWLALAVLTVDGLRAARRNHLARTTDDAELATAV